MWSSGSCTLGDATKIIYRMCAVIDDVYCLSSLDIRHCTLAWYGTKSLLWLYAFVTARLYPVRADVSVTWASPCASTEARRASEQVELSSSDFLLGCLGASALFSQLKEHGLPVGSGFRHGLPSAGVKLA